MQFAYQFEWEQCNRDSNDYTSSVSAAAAQQLLLIAGPTDARTTKRWRSISDKTHSTEHAAHLHTEHNSAKYQF